MKKCLCIQINRIINAKQATMSFLAEMIPPRGSELSCMMGSIIIIIIIIIIINKTKKH